MENINSRQFNYLFNGINKETQQRMNLYCKTKGLLKYRFVEAAISSELKINDICEYKNLKDLREKMNKHCAKIGVFQHQFIKQIIQKVLEKEGF